MANPGTLPVTLVTILLLVAPGYLAVRVFLRAAERNDTLDRTGKVVWSSAASLGSLLVLYAASPLHFELLSTAGQALTGQYNVVSGSDLVASRLSTGVLLYLLHIVLLLTGSLVAGSADKSRRDDPYGERQPWYYALADLGEEEIGVLLQDGSRIDGTFVPAAWDPSTKDLVLENPRRTESMPEPLGRSILISSEDISAVVFTEEDPNRETGEEVEPSESATETIEEMRQTYDSGSEESSRAEDEGTETNSSE